MKKDDIKKIVKDKYSQIAKKKGSCCSCNCDSGMDDETIAKQIGYSDTEIASVGGANMGLGCGNPTGMGEIHEGDTVIDLGSGAGFDAFLAAQKTGKSGKVVGIDMTDEMIDRAKANAKKLGYENVSFVKGDIENLPLDDQSADVIISNCVINLAPDKMKVYREAYRVLKSGGRMYVSDIVLLAPLTDEQKSDEDLLAGCVAGAVMRDEYIDMIKKAGFSVRIIDEDKKISKTQYRGVNLESLKIEGRKLK